MAPRRSATRASWMRFRVRRRPPGVPNFIIRKFRVPPFLLPIYQAAGIEYGIRWEVLAAINEIETDYGRNLNVSSAGAVGWMQFIPSTWRMYGTDANDDGRKDPYNPVDAIFAAARYLSAAGYEDDVRRAIFAYNHADWYVDSVLLRARLIAGVPADLVGSLTGLTEGRFPVYARARYADDSRGPRRADAANLDRASRGIGIFARQGAPVVAVNDGVIRKVGREPAARQVRGARGRVRQPLHLRAPRLGVELLPGAEERRPAVASPQRRPSRADDDPTPTAPASAGSQPDPKAQSEAETSAAPAARTRRLAAGEGAPVRPSGRPRRQRGRRPGADARRRARKTGRYETFDAYFSRPFRLDPSKVRLRRLEKGSRVIGGTVLGRVGAPGRGRRRTPVLLDPARPARARRRSTRSRSSTAGSCSRPPRSTAPPGATSSTARRATRSRSARCCSGRSACSSAGCSPTSASRSTTAAATTSSSGQVDRRVLATLEYLAESGLRPTVTSLKCGHGFHTASGNVSEHSSGNAVDIAKINGIPILGHQEAGGITEQTVRRLMRLQGTMQPHQIISPARAGRLHHGDGRPRRPHPRGLQGASPRSSSSRASGPTCWTACARSRTRWCRSSPPSSRCRSRRSAPPATTSPGLRRSRTRGRQAVPYWRGRPLPGIVGA